MAFFKQFVGRIKIQVASNGVLKPLIFDMLIN